MKERVLKILNLCLMAKSMGHNVWFNYAPHIQEVEVYAFDSKYNFEPDEEPDRLFRYSVYLKDNERSIKNTMENIETAIQKLIDGEFE